MSTLQRPGVYVNETVFPTYAPVSPTVTYSCFIGAHPRGPLGAVQVSSWSQFVKLYGGFIAGQVPSPLALALYEWYANGGSGKVYVIRVVHDDAVAAAQPLSDDSEEPTINVFAGNPGAWGNNVSLQVTPNTSLATFDLVVLYSGTVMERWSNLSMDQSSAQYFKSQINNLTQGSQYIYIEDVQGTSTVPGNLPVAVSVTLGVGPDSTPGMDGSAPSHGDYTDTTAILDLIDAPLLINFPANEDTADVIGPMISYIENQRAFQDSMLIIDPPAGLAPQTMIQSYVPAIEPSSYAAIYYPWLVVADPAASSRGATRKVPPGALAMAQMSVTDASPGPWAAPAGLRATLATVQTTEIALNAEDLGDLNQAQINVIRFVQGSGICIMGARTLANVANLLYINKRRSLIYIESQLRQLTQFAIFQNNDSTLRLQVASRLSNFLSQLYASGGLVGNATTDAFYVTCDDTNNTPTTIAQGQVIVEVGVALQTPAEFIVISIGQWEGGSSVTEMVSGTPVTTVS